MLHHGNVLCQVLIELLKMQIVIGLLTVPLVATALQKCALNKYNNSTQLITNFPHAPLKPFYFGASNSAFQAEGEPGDSDWRRWIQSNNPSRVEDKSNASFCNRFWQFYDQDFAFAQASNMNAFRMSIAWERIEPSLGAWDNKALQHYITIITSMRKRNIEPFITLQHFVLPGWVADNGGVLWLQYPQRFAKFSAYVAQALHAAPANVKYFITLNEPDIQVRFGYLNTTFPPGANNLEQAERAFAALAEAHIEAYASIHTLNLSPVYVGFSHNWQLFRPKDSKIHCIAISLTR